MPGDLVIRDAQVADREVLHREFNRILAAGEGYPQAGPVDAEEFADYWLERKAAVLVAETGDGRFVGSYYLKPNHPGRAAHIANAGYFVTAGQRGRGYGRRLVEHSIELAPTLGFDALQFNLVFESNPGRTMYESLGFEVIGRLPDAVDGEDAVIYWRPL